MKRRAMPGPGRGSLFGALILAFACVGAAGIATPASAASSDTIGARTVAQPVVPNASIGSQPVARGCYNGGQITLQDGYPGSFSLVPAGDWNLCVTVAGGLGSGHQMILGSCTSQADEAFDLSGSTSVKDRLGMAAYAASYIGYRDNPAGTFCNMFSRYWNDGSTAGCGSTGNYDTEWCADFAAYVWRFGGDVSFNYQYTAGYINGGAASFAQYAKVKGTWHAAASGYVPRPGDVAVYGLNSAGTWAGHAAVVLGLAPGNSGPNVVNGDYIYDAEYTTDQTQASGALAGYASPPGL